MTGGRKTSVTSSGRMRKQVKARMNDLLTSEETARREQDSLPSAPPLSDIVSPASPDASMCDSTAVSGARGTRVAAKADMVFHLSEGMAT